MTTSRYDVLGIGNALVDVIAPAEEDFLSRFGMRKGGMALIDAAGAERIYTAMGSTTAVSGGSAANTTVGVASLGARAAFIGKVAADSLGRVFTHDIRAVGVAFGTPAAALGPATGRCLILVTPDGERTMNTYLGAAQNLTPADIDADLVASSALTYLEGYLWDPAEAKLAFLKAAQIAHDAQRKVALSLSDAFCVDRWREEFLPLIRSRTVDLTLANEAELKSLYASSDFEDALACLRQDAALAVITRGAEGCVVLTRERVEVIPAVPIMRLVDATGAGDLFAAGFLVGLCRGQDTATAARLGALSAAEIIQHFGARPQCSLKALAEQNQLSL
jgi:sugar/nucleoside kinase (ribokinase family)